MTRASFLTLLLSSFALTSCTSVSLGGSQDDAGTPSSGGGMASGSGGQAGTGAGDAPASGGYSGGGTGGTGTCQPRSFDVDCYRAAAIYTCVQRGGEWVWDYTCPDPATDGGPVQADTQTVLQHPYVSTGAACIDYPVSGYRVFPYDTSINDHRTWPTCTLNCTTVTPVFGPAGNPVLDQALPAGACDDEGATCDSPVMTGWCGPCANVGGPGNGYTCVCRGHNWHCALTSLGMNVCGMPTCIAPSATIPPPASCATTTWTDNQICTCGVCRDLCDSDAQCSSGRCKLNQVCRKPSDKCTGPDECPAPCRGLCEPMTTDGGVDGNSPRPVDAASSAGCDLAKAAQAVSAAGLTPVGDPATVSQDLPSNLDASANWGLKKIVCSDGGYDLSTVAGQSVCLARFPTTQVCQDQPTDAWVVMSDETVRCVYQTVRAGSGLTPGVFSVHDALCSSPDAAN